jgi:two-component sensor histidine kinase
MNAPTLANRPRPTGARVLYAEDDAGLRSLVGRRLGRVGHTIFPAENGDEALRFLAGGESVDVVVLDHAMPGKDGLETLAAIRGRPEPPPVIFVTGQEDPRLAVTALKAGAVDYVVKDVAGEFIFLVDAAIRAAVDRERLRRAKEEVEREVRLARDRAERLAEERSLLMREMNHRVANSLQLVAAMLHLQASGSEDEGIRAALGEARERVFAVGQIHTRLYNSDDVQSVGMVEYLGALVEDLQRNAEAAGDGSARARSGVAITLDAEPVELSPDQGVAVGVIVTELVINALKHAFPAGSGTIAVGLRRAEGSLEITVADDGVGYEGEPSAVPAGRRGLGTSIIGAMLSKLGGSLERTEARPGTRVSIRFAAAAAPVLQPA